MRISTNPISFSIRIIGPQFLLRIEAHRELVEVFISVVLTWRQHSSSLPAALDI